MKPEGDQIVADRLFNILQSPSTISNGSARRPDPGKY